MTNDNHCFRDTLSLQALVDLAREAGMRILDIYQRPRAPEITLKADNSPVTAADIAAHHCIVDALPGLLDIPIISEEGEIPPPLVRQSWTQYWLIDPLDGTREFITGNGEFTVNIALIENGRPVLGVVHAPVEDVTYAAINVPDESQQLALKYIAGKNPQPLAGRQLAERKEKGLPLLLLASHRHSAADLHSIVAPLERQWQSGVVVKHAGSSLKFCLLAEGKADFYPRYGATSEWDTAASQAILEAAGGAIISAGTINGEWLPLIYNRNDSLLNPFFYAMADRRFNWRDFLQFPIPAAL